MAAKTFGGRVVLPNARVSQFPRTPARIMGPGPEGTGKPGAPPPEDTFYFGPVSSLTFVAFTEIWKRSIKGFSRGKVLVSCDAILSTTTNAFIRPRLYVDVEIVGFTNGVPETLGFGATGQILAIPSGPSGGVNQDAPPVVAEWDDSFSFDEVAVNVRTMGNGGIPLGNTYGAPLWVTSTGDALNVGIAGKLWR